MSRDQSDRALIEEIEQELQRALAIEPSPDFGQRVRRQIVQTSVNPLAGRIRWLVPLAAAVACTVAIGIGWRAPEDSDPPPAAASTRLVRDVVLHAPPTRVPADTRRPLAPQLVRAAVVAEGHVAPAEPEIIISPDRAVALARLLALARTGVVDEENLRPIASTTPPLFLEVAPLVVPPIDVPEIDTGTRIAPGGATQE